MRSLATFYRAALAPDESKAIEIKLPVTAFTRVSAAAERHFVFGAWDIVVGASPPVVIEMPEPVTPAGSSPPAPVE